METTPFSNLDNMKILLINPPFGQEYSVGGSKSIKRVLNIVQPLGLAYLAAVLLKENYLVSIIDCTAGISTKSLLKNVSEEKPDLIGITATTPSFGSAESVAKQIRQILPKTIIIIGGAHITAMPESILSSDAFNIGILGEAEETLLKLVRHIEGYGLKNIEAVKGIVFKSGSELIHTGRRNFIKRLDDLPFPARELLPPLKKYHPTPASYRYLPYATLITSRGCPCQCAFCDRAIFGNIARLRSAANVLDEIEELINKYKVKEIRFFDDTLTIDKNRVYEICEGLQKRKINIHWTCLTGVKFVTEDLLKTMKQAGCWQVLYGFESGDQETLKRLKKGATLEDNIRAVEMSKKAGINIRGEFIVGAPGETLQSMKRTVQFAIDMKLDYAVFNKFVPFPGTEFYKNLINEGYNFNFKKACSIFDHSALLYVPNGMNEADYKKFLDTSLKKFYLRPSYIFKRLVSIRTWAELKGQMDGFFSISGL